MNRYLAMTAAAALAGAAVLASSPAGAGTLPRIHGAGAAKGARAFNITPGGVDISSVSCTSAGNCTAGGDYIDPTFLTQALVVSQVNGVWGKPEEVPGTGALNTSGIAEVYSVSCPSAGNCSAGGYYTGDATPNDQQAFVASEVNGVWGNAEEVPGSAGLNGGGAAYVASVSCASAGNCSAGGSYIDNSGAGQAFVVSEVNGAWGQAEEIPGSAGLNQGSNAYVYSVSCGSAGNCSATGSYTDSSAAVQAFVVNEVNGVWDNAAEIPGTGALNQGAQAVARDVSCASPGNCGAAGYYMDSAKHYQPFVASQVNGVWGTAKEVPGIGTLSKGNGASAASVSCASAGNCTAAGTYSTGTVGEPFVVSQVNGVWGKAKEVPGIATLNKADAGSSSVSCGSAGNCSVGGVYNDATGFPHQQVFVASQVNGVWGKAKEIPGSGALNLGNDATFSSVSCASAGNCTAAGGYTDSHDDAQGFVVSQVKGVWGKAEQISGPRTG